MTLVYWSLPCTATFVFRFHWSLLLAFSLHFSSSSAFLRSLLTQSSHLSCGLPRFLQPSCVFVLDIFGHLSSFILTMYPAHFIPLLAILPTMQSLVQTSNFFSHVFHSANDSNLFFPMLCNDHKIVCIHTLFQDIGCAYLPADLISSITKMKKTMGLEHCLVSNRCSPGTPSTYLIQLLLFLWCAHTLLQPF